jgi:hypothetical protein
MILNGTPWVIKWPRGMRRSSVYSVVRWFIDVLTDRDIGIDFWLWPDLQPVCWPGSHYVTQTGLEPLGSSNHPASPSCTPLLSSWDHRHIPPSPAWNFPLVVFPASVFSSVIWAYSLCFCNPQMQVQKHTYSIVHTFCPLETGWKAKEHFSN